MFTLLCTVSFTTVFSIHVLISFLHGYSATLAAKLIIKLELSWDGSLFFNHQFTPVSRSQTALSGMLHLTCQTSFLLLFLFLISLLHRDHPALLHHQDLTLHRLMRFLLAFSTLVWKLYVSQSLSLHAHLSLAQAYLLEFGHFVFGSHSLAVVVLMSAAD